MYDAMDGAAWWWAQISNGQEINELPIQRV